DWSPSAAFQYVLLSSSRSPESRFQFGIVTWDGTKSKPPCDTTGLSKLPFLTTFIPTRRVPRRNEFRSPLLPVIVNPKVSPLLTLRVVEPEERKPFEGGVQPLEGAPGAGRAH